MMGVGAKRALGLYRSCAPRHFSARMVTSGTARSEDCAAEKKAAAASRTNALAESMLSISSSPWKFLRNVDGLITQTARSRTRSAYDEATPEGSPGRLPARRPAIATNLDFGTS